MDLLMWSSEKHDAYLKYKEKQKADGKKRT